MTDDHILEVVQAHKEGKKIEVNLGMGWLELSKCTQEHYPNFQTGSFRVAPEPGKPREWLLKLDEYGNHAGFMLPLIPKGGFQLQQKYEEVRVREVLE